MAKKIFKNMFIYSFSLICILPMLIMLIYSFKSIEGNFSLAQYGKALFQTEDFFIGFWNSTIYTFVIIGINIPLSLLSAYGFTRFKFKSKNILYWLYIVLMLMPFQATMVAQYITLKKLSIIDNPIAVIIPNIFSTFGTILMAQYMRGINNEIYDAGKIDGLNEFRLFLRIAAPLCKSIISALTILLFINYWSMVEQPLVFIKDTIDMPLAVTLNASKRFRNITFACGTLFSILPILLYQFSYEDLVHGIGITSFVKVNEEYSKERKGKGKENILKIIKFFMIIMIVFTLLTQKITYIMMPTVEVVGIKSGDMKSNPSDYTSPSIGYYTSIIPSSCIYGGGQNKYIYTVMKEKSRRERLEAVKMAVTVIADNGFQVAIQGGFSPSMQIVERSTKQLIDGMIVRVADNRGASHEE